MFERRLLKPFYFICVFIGIKSAGVFESQVSKLSSYKVVIPQIVHQQWKRHTHHSEETEQAVKTDRLTYSLNIEDKDHVLHLERNKEFLAKDFVQYTYDDNGNLVTAYPGVHNHCYYHGQVDGHEDSWLALSTCLGLRGVIFFGNKSYGLEPVIQSPANEHLLFPLKQSQSESGVCGVSNQTPDFDTHNLNDPTLSMTRLLRKKRNLPQTRYVELVLVVDKKKYDMENGNVTAVQKQMVELANLLDGYYQQLNIRVALVGLEILNSGNPFNVDGLAGEVLGNFVKWRKSDLLPRIRHDVGQLVVGRTSSFSRGILGMAFVGTVCSASSGGGISAFITGSSLVFFSTVVAHEMGHNMGMNHDQGQCTCRGGSCIMDPTAGGSTKFSNCSGNDFELLILRGGGICLKNVPPPSSIITTPACGNGMLEEGEQCDCGQPQDCNDKCCDAATCRFTPGSRCSQGSCCSECQIKVSGTPCRTSVDTCDLPEFCNGQSAFCPSDYYIMDGLQCDDNTAYCFEGRCQTFDFQCQRLFGNNARKAADVCFNTINGNGDQFGNCGLIGSTYIKCSVADSLCGKVQCTNVNANFPPTGAIVSVQNIGGEKCVNADFNLGPDVRDPAYVNPGSLCAMGKTCLDFKCTNASALRPNFSCDAQGTCNGRGVCNNQGNCHCDDGWAPPFCNTWGRGGSVDSGPAQIDFSLRNGLLIFFLLVVPVLILIAVVLLYVFRRDWLTRCKRRRSRRSPTTTNNPATAQRNSTPQPQAQNPTIPPQPPLSYPRATPVVESSYSNLKFGRTATPQPVPQQGPGVPKRIPPKQAPPIPRA